MLRLQVREIRAWLSGDKQDPGAPPAESCTPQSVGLDSGLEGLGGLDTVEVVADDGPVIDTKQPQAARPH